MYLVVARIVSPQGSRGEVKAEIVTDFPERFASTSAVYLGPEHLRYRVQGYRLLGDTVVLKLEGVDTIDQAERLRGKLVEVPEEEAVELPQDHYFWHQILGLQVVTLDGEPLGQIDEILETGSNDVYVVHGPRGELLIPAIKQVVKSVDLATGKMVVELMPEYEEQPPSHPISPPPGESRATPGAAAPGPRTNHGRTAESLQNKRRGAEEDRSRRGR